MATLETLEKRIDGLEQTLEQKIDTRFDELAIMIKDSFEHVEERFEGIDNRLDKIDDRFDRIENVSIGGHERRIEHLEDRMRIVETKSKLRKK